MQLDPMQRIHEAARHGRWGPARTSPSRLAYVDMPVCACLCTHLHDRSQTPIRGPLRHHAAWHMHNRPPLGGVLGTTP